MRYHRQLQDDSYLTFFDMLALDLLRQAHASDPMLAIGTMRVGPDRAAFRLRLFAASRAPSGRASPPRGTRWPALECQRAARWRGPPTN